MDSTPNNLYLHLNPIYTTQSSFEDEEDQVSVAFNMYSSKYRGNVCMSVANTCVKYFSLLMYTISLQQQWILLPMIVDISFHLIVWRQLNLLMLAFKVSLMITVGLGLVYHQIGMVGLMLIPLLSLAIVL